MSRKHLNGLDAGGKVLTGVGTPSSSSDGTPKGYVDTATGLAAAKLANLSDLASATTALANLGTAKTLVVTAGTSVPGGTPDGTVYIEY